MASLTRRTLLALAAAASAGCRMMPRRLAQSPPPIPDVRSSQAGPGPQTVVCSDFTADGISAAIATAGPFGDVYLPQGDYAINRTITIPVDGVTIRGAGQATALHAADESFNLFYLVQQVSVTISDLYIVGAGRDGAGGIGILADSCRGCSFERLIIERCGSADASAIHLRGTRFSRISDCTLTGNGRGIHLFQDATNNVIDACTGRRNAKEMIFVTEGCTDCAVVNCTSDGDGSSGAAVSIAIHKSDRTVLSHTSVLRSGHEQGVEIAAGNDNVVSGCTIAESNWAGVHIVNAQRTVLVGNAITGNQQAGVLLRSAGDASESRPSDGCVIVGNVIDDNNPTAQLLAEQPWSGIEIEHANLVRIERNLLRNNHGAAAHIGPGNRGTQLAGNRFEGDHATLVVDQGSETSSDVP